MKWIGLFFCCCYSLVHAQDVDQQLQKGIKQLEADSQMKHALIAMYVVETQTGKKVFAHHEQVGLVPASTQKIITAAAAFEMLGQSFKYTTSIGYHGKIVRGVLEGPLIVKASGDPTFGSERWVQTKKEVQIKSIVASVKNAGITQINGGISIDAPRFSKQLIPDGWIWQDIGNYYGAGAGALNWGENQFDITLSSGENIDSQVTIVELENKVLANATNYKELTAAPKGTGDNAFIYLPNGESPSQIKGTIPINETAFKIAGADPFVITNFESDLINALNKGGIKTSIVKKDVDVYNGVYQQLLAIHSPILDSIQLQFLRKSINLYGEALIKSIALQTYNWASTEKGVEAVKKFWAKNGINENAIQIMDGSGLSPQNRVTAFALVQVLQFAKNRPWFAAFYQALPVYNGMKLKSGSIGGARAFTGYHTAKNGKQYSIAIMVNNYSGSSGAMVKKLFQLLDNLK